MRYRLQLALINGPERFRARIRRIPDEAALKPVELAVLLLLIEAPEGDTIDPDPRTIPSHACGADGLAVLPQEGGLRLDGNQNALPIHAALQMSGCHPRAEPSLECLRNAVTMTLLRK